jgi:hypothetical protein
MISWVGFDGGINELYVMRKAGFCVDEGCGGFGLIFFHFLSKIQETN